MKLAIASGKGGTGKSMVAANTAFTLALTEPVTLVDCDVEEPNLHLFFSGQTEEQTVTIPVPEIDTSTCTLCGKCGQSVWVEASGYEATGSTPLFDRHVLGQGNDGFRQTTEFSLMIPGGLVDQVAAALFFGDIGVRTALFEQPADDDVGGLRVAGEQAGAVSQHDGGDDEGEPQPHDEGVQRHPLRRKQRGLCPWG